MGEINPKILSKRRLNPQVIAWKSYPSHMEVISENNFEKEVKISLKSLFKPRTQVFEKPFTLSIKIPIFFYVISHVW